MTLTIHYNKYRLELLFTFIITVCYTTGFSQLKADFTAITTSGCAPLTINFNDLSAGNPNSWQWNLGNGTISTKQSPSVSYFNSGTYTVTLKISNATGKDSITKINYITVYEYPIIDFSVSNASGCFPLKVNFTD